MEALGWGWKGIPMSIAELSQPEDYRTIMALWSGKTLEKGSLPSSGACCPGRDSPGREANASYSGLPL